jgi:PAS domain-containing protein
MPRPLNLEKINPSLQEFVVLFDNIRRLRREEVEREKGLSDYFSNWEYGQESSSVEPTKRWTLSELPSALNFVSDIRKGNSKKVPSRMDVNEIADYLHCNLKERNDLLMSLGYHPAEPLLTDEEYRRALDAARRVMNYIPLPAYILTRDWTVQDWNEHILAFLGWSQEYVSAILPQRLNILHLIFDHRLGMRERLEVRSSVWEEMAWRNVYGFINHNILCRYDPWYKELVKELLELPDFRRVWLAVTRDTVPEQYRYLHIDFTTDILAPNGKLARFHSIFICNGDLYYPQVAAYIPADDESRSIFAELGIPVPESGWRTKLLE